MIGDIWEYLRVIPESQGRGYREYLGVIPGSHGRGYREYLGSF